MPLLRQSLVVGLAAGLSRVLGFVRDVLIAGSLGTGPAGQALMVALQLPNLVRRSLSEGALNAGFVPLYLGLKAREGRSAARRFAGEALGGLTLLALALVGLVELAAGGMVLLLAAGLGDSPEARDLAALYLRLSAPFVAAVALASLVSAYLNAERRVLAAALGPLLVNLAVIGTLLAIGGSGMPPGNAGAFVAVAITASGLLHLALVAAAAARLPGGLPLARPRLSPDARRLGALALPLVLTGAAAQLMVLAASWVASFTPAALAWLAYADRVFQLPLGFVAAGAGLVLLPEIAGRRAAADREGARDAQNRALEGAVLLALPAAAALVLLAEPITRVLYVRGAFTEADAAGVASCLAGLAPGLLPAAFARVLQQGLLAAGLVRPTAVAAGLGVAATGPAAALLLQAFGTAGLGLGVATGLVVQAVLLARAAGSGDDPWRPDARLAAQALRAAAATAGMGLSLVLLLRALDPVPPGAAGAAPLALLVAAGLLAYGGSAVLLGAYGALRG